MGDFKKEEDGTVIDQDGKILVFGIERFKRDVVFGGCCFICGVEINDNNRNQEHIFPNWILRQFDLHGKQITLPNLSNFKYDQYVIPCCADCNTLMGKVFEEKIAPAVAKGYLEFFNLVKNEGARLIYNWIALIVIKTHLKDAQLRASLDLRDGNQSIGESLYDYELLHHVHCLARSFYTKALWGPGVRGSMFIGPAKIFDGMGQFECFDYGDLYLGKTAFIRLNDICILAVLNDGGVVINSMIPQCISKIGKESLNPLQIRELLARFSHCNVSLKTRPKFHSVFDSEKKNKIIAEIPDQIEFIKFNASKYGDMMWKSCGSINGVRENISSDVIENIKRGVYSFILDEKQNFKTDSMLYKENL